MILLDTHIWIWWVNGSNRLTTLQKKTITDNESKEIGVSIISCWEAAKLVENDRLELTRTIQEWMKIALNYPGITLLALTPEIVIESTQLPEFSHRDPADQMIVATSRVLNCPLITSDSKLLQYRHIETIG